MIFLVSRLLLLSGSNNTKYPMDNEPTDSDFMLQALDLANKASDMGEVPVGALLVKEDNVIGRGWNQPIHLHDPSAHAEMMAIRDAGQQLGNYRLPETTLYVTLEPCMMCAGLMIHTRIKRIVFGAFDPKTGADGSMFSLINDSRHNHQIEVVGGVLQKECSEILKSFFRGRRKNN